MAQQKRFISFWLNDDSFQALSEDDYKKSGLNQNNFEEFIWQLAESTEQAMQQHDEKFLIWRNEVDSGLPQKDTY